MFSYHFVHTSPICQLPLVLNASSIDGWCNTYFDWSRKEKQRKDGTDTEELHMWQAKWRGISDRPTTLQDSLKHCDVQLYQNVRTVLEISCVFPVTSWECERSISALGLVKSKLRSSMGQDRLSSLCLLSIHRNIDIDIKRVVRELARKNPRKMALPDLMSEL